MLPPSGLHGKGLPYDVDKGKKASNIPSIDTSSKCSVLGDGDFLVPLDSSLNLSTICYASLYGRSLCVCECLYMYAKLVC